MSVTDKHAQANHIAALQNLIEELKQHRHQMTIAVNCYIGQMATRTKIEDIYELVKKKGSDIAFVEQLEAMMERDTISQNESSGLDMGTSNPPSSPLVNTNTEEIYKARLVAALVEKEREMSERLRFAVAAAEAAAEAAAAADADADTADTNAAANAAALAAANKKIERLQTSLHTFTAEQVEAKRIAMKESQEKFERQEKISQKKLDEAESALKKSQDKVAELMVRESGDSDSNEEDAIVVIVSGESKEDKEVDVTKLSNACLLQQLSQAFDLRKKARGETPDGLLSLALTARTMFSLLDKQDSMSDHTVATRIELAEKLCPVIMKMIIEALFEIKTDLGEQTEVVITELANAKNVNLDDPFALLTHFSLETKTTKKKNKNLFTEFVKRCRKGGEMNMTKWAALVCFHRTFGMRRVKNFEDQKDCMYFFPSFSFSFPFF